MTGLLWTVSGVFAVPFLFLAGWFAYDLWKERTLTRHVDSALAILKQPGELRCLVCDTPVADMRTHSALAHTPRTLGPEDTQEWGGAR